MSELLIEGTTALIAGMGTVFIILILISFIIGALEYTDPINREKKMASIAAKKARGKGSAISTDENMQEIDLDEQARVVAAISVTLATALNIRVDRLHVKSIRRY